MGIKKTLSSFTTKFAPNNNFNKGFTFIEMLIIVPIAILTIGVFVAAIVNMTGEVLAVRETNSLTYDIQTALNKIEQDVSLSGAYLSVNNIDLSATPYQGYDNGSTYNASTTNFHNADATNGAMLILNAYTTASNPLDTTRNIVYTSAQPNACNSSLVNQNPPVMVNIIYFIKDNTLWRRVIAPSYYDTVGCVGTSVGTPWQQPSCAINISGTLCKTQDVRLVDNVKASDFVVNYYAGSDSTTANAIASDSAQTDSARSAALQTTNTVSVSIAAKTTIAGRDISQSGSIRAVSPNNNRSLTVSTTSPTEPTGLTAVGGTNQETLTWTAPTNNGGSTITGYKIYRGNTSNSEIFLIKLGNVLTYTDTSSLNSNTTYYYKVAAVNNIGESILSGEANGTTAAPVTITFNPTSTGQTGTIQTWTVPVTGNYSIIAAGAIGGGISSAGGGGGVGTSIISLTVGQIVKLLVGQSGTSGGGGGGSFVYNSTTSTLLLAVGGGGGGTIYGVGGYGGYGTGGNGQNQYGSGGGCGCAGSGGGTGGVNGNGASTAPYAPGGGGYLSNGATSSSGYGVGGAGYMQGGVGSTGNSTGYGGFGGGGGYGNSLYGGGGGGGYNGGGGGANGSGGGGGGYTSTSWASGSNGGNSSAGYIIITLL